ncbi:uncharacterized protein LOC116176475 [Photinus pyralis]|uniref:uncharacterized protein LOC116176475 n=1 Tax=Photinus pyralis TaxID=7054 RepID=UPI0012673EC1|nr:uncharacterized protein LOC116176475 [Photinus pyralis]XP_031350938.1 uncharacterized protein LOC116176475 [Photinus pyralis]
MVVIEISLMDILEYVGDRKRPLIEGEAVFKAGHIILCGLESEEPNVIRSLCLQTSALKQLPHEISIRLDTPTWQCRCSCKAGLSGYCKHVIATLIYVNRNENLDFISCTELRQKWGQEKKAVQEMYATKPFSEFCHPTNIKKSDIVISSEVTKMNFNLLVAAVGNSALSSFKQRSLQNITELPPQKRSSVCEVVAGGSNESSSHQTDQITSSSVKTETKTEKFQSLCIENLINFMDANEYTQKFEFIILFII